MSKPIALVELVTHTSTTINGENVVLRKREWVRSDDPRLAPPCGYKFVTGPTPGINKPAEEINKPAEENLSLPSAQPGAAVPQVDTVEGGCAMEPKRTEPKSAEVASARSNFEETSVAQSSVSPTTAAQTTAPSPAKNMLANLSIPRKEPQHEVKMSSDELNEEDYYEDDDVEANEQQDDDEVEADEEEEDDDRPWPITKRTLAEIDDMSPTELKDLIENVGWHERWQDLREDAKRKTSQWLTGMKKAEAAPRCQFVKVNGTSCGSPAVKGETLCYFHGDARKRRETDAEARKLGMPTLEDRLSVQLAIMRVCNQLVEKSIDEKTGRAVISALRLAHRNIGDQESLL